MLEIYHFPLRPAVESSSILPRYLDHEASQVIEALHGAQSQFSCTVYCKILMGSIHVDIGPTAHVLGC